MFRFITNKRVEIALKKRFPGWVGKFVNDGNDWHLETTSDIDFYHLYPALSPEEADNQHVKDIIVIVRRYLPEATLEGYEQHGQYIKCEAA